MSLKDTVSRVSLVHYFGSFVLIFRTSNFPSRRQSQSMRMKSIFLLYLCLLPRRYKSSGCGTALRWAGREPDDDEERLIWGLGRRSKRDVTGSRSQRQEKRERVGNSSSFRKGSTSRVCVLRKEQRIKETGQDGEDMRCDESTFSPCVYLSSSLPVSSEGDDENGKRRREGRLCSLFSRKNC